MSLPDIVLPDLPDPTKPKSAQLSVNTQAGRRRLDNLYDQHRNTKMAKFEIGRPWWGYRERAAMHGDRDGFLDLHPGEYFEKAPGVPDRRKCFNSAWSAPWLPHQNYFVIDLNRNRITIRYDRIISYYQREYIKYYRAAAVTQRQVPGALPVRLGVMPDFGVVAVVGYPPLSPKIPQAAQAGDPWILGFEDRVYDRNVELAELLNVGPNGEPLLDPLMMEQLTPTISVDTIAEAEQRVEQKTLDPLELQKMIAEAVANALAQQEALRASREEDKKRKQRESGSKNLAKARAAKAAKAENAAKSLSQGDAHGPD